MKLTPLSQTRQSAPCRGALPTIPNRCVCGFRLELSRTSGGASQKRLVTPTGGTARGKIQESIVPLLFTGPMDLCADYRAAHQPSRIAFQSMNPMTAPVATNDTRLVAKYGYTMSSSPATICGHRPCFLPYTNRTNPTPPGMSEANSHVGSKDTD